MPYASTMFVKPSSKYNKTTKKRYSIYQLCESYRLDGHVRQRLIIGLGKLEELPGDERILFLCRCIEELLTQNDNKLPLPHEDGTVEKLARFYFGEMKKKAMIGRL